MSNDTKLNPYLSRYIIFDGTNGGDVERWSDYQIMEYNSIQGPIVCTCNTEHGDPLAIFPNTVVDDRGPYYATVTLSQLESHIAFMQLVERTQKQKEQRSYGHLAIDIYRNTGLTPEFLAKIEAHIDEYLRRSKDANS